MDDLPHGVVLAVVGVWNTNGRACQDSIINVLNVRTNKTKIHPDGIKPASQPPPGGRTGAFNNVTFDPQEQKLPSNKSLRRVLPLPYHPFL